MKKVALSLLALALFGAGAFAQSAASAFTVGGYLDVGTNTYIGADTGTSTVVKGDDSGILGGSYEFKGAYALSDKAGVKFNVRIEGLTNGVNNFTATPAVITGTQYNTQNAYVWFLTPGLEALKVLAGNVDGSAWGALDDKGDNVSGGQAIQLQYTPMAGFTFGGQVAVAGKSNPGYSAGFAYTADKVVTVQFGAKTALNKDKAAALDNVNASFKLLLDGPLSLKGGVNVYSMASTGAVATDIIDVTLGYAVTDAFSATLLTYAYLYGSDIKSGADAAALSFKVNPSVSYTVNPVVSIGLGATYGSGSLSTASANNKLTTIEVNPSATFQIDANTKLIVNYVYDTLSGDGKPATDQSYSTFKTDFRYSF